MKVHNGKFNDQYHLAHVGEDSPINIDIAGMTRPSEEYYISCTTPQSFTLSFYQFEYVLDGRFLIDIDGHTHSAEKGDFCFINKGVPRTLYTDKKNPVKKFFVTVKGPLADGMIKAYGFKAPVIIQKADVEEYFRNIIKILEDAPNFSPSERDAIGCEVLKIIQKVASDIWNAEKAPEKRYTAENILRYIDSNLDRKFTIEELSQNFFLGKTQLIKVFKDKYGVTPIKYAQLQRIETAKYYLAKTDEPISTLHYKLGFDDTKYFSKLFKKVTGISPSEYRDTINLPVMNDPVVRGKFSANPGSFKKNN